MNRLHIAIAVTDVQRSVEDYSQRLACRPVVVVPDEYALWRTETVNFSIRRAPESAGSLRHLGWEDPNSLIFTKDTDSNGIVWERFSAKLQEQEIKDAWPNAEFAEAEMAGSETPG